MSLSAKTVAVRLPSSGDTRRNLRRLFPASFASLFFHGAMMTLFVLLSSPGQAEIPVEPAMIQSVIGTETQTYDPARDDPFLSTVRNDYSKERHQDPVADVPRKDEVTIPGQADPLDNVGLKGGALDGVLRDLGQQFGMTKFGSGLAGAIDGPNPNSDKLLPPGGVIFGGHNRDYFKVIRGSAATRSFLLEKGGGTGASEAAVAKGLQWLARNQAADGSWRLDGNFPDKGSQNDVAGAAFGLLPFLGAGKTHKSAKDNPYDKPIEKALKYLIDKQDRRTGNFGGGMYGHGLATIAICEAYGLTQDPLLRRPAALAIKFIVAAQHDGGGWRYAPNQAGDTSVTGWHIMALKSAEMAGLDVPEITMKKAQRYLDGCVSPVDEGYGYVGIGSRPTTTAVGLLCRQYLQSWGPQNIRLIKAIDLHLKPNAPAAKRDIYYYYYATQVMRHFGGEAWRNWNEKMRDTLVKTQDDNPKGPQFGSWPAAGDPHASSGGRLMVTSLSLLTLEVYYRHLPLYYRDMGAPDGMKKKGT
ncbi:MAG: terpene cyclase/mutase family protein [Gemmataceae bacterium]|nr:terpene cyclase/mutase family protein [Gemmataceae bacterium]